MIIIVQLDVWIFCDEEDSFRDIDHHLIGIPYMNLMSSTHAALFMYPVEALLIFLSITLIVCLNSFIALTTIELSNIAVDNCRKMRYLLNVSDRPHVVREQLQKFDRNLITAVEQHQIFIR